MVDTLSLPVSYQCAVLVVPLLLHTKYPHVRVSSCHMTDLWSCFKQRQAHSPSSLQHSPCSVRQQAAFNIPHQLSPLRPSITTHYIYTHIRIHTYIHTHTHAHTYTGDTMQHTHTYKRTHNGSSRSIKSIKQTPTHAHKMCFN